MLTNLSICDTEHQFWSKCLSQKMFFGVSQKYATSS